MNQGFPEMKVKENYYFNYYFTHYFHCDLKPAIIKTL